MTRPAVAALRAEWERFSAHTLAETPGDVEDLFERLLAALEEAEREYAKCYAGLTAERLAVENRDKRGAVLEAPPRTQDEAPAPPRTERMDLHKELDRRFPLIADFKAWVGGEAGPTSSQSADVSQDRTDLAISERRPASDSSALALCDAIDAAIASRKAGGIDAVMLMIHEAYPVLAAAVRGEAGPLPPEPELLTRLRSLLETFGEHLSDCERPDKANDEDCTCGFRLNLMAVRDLVPYSHEVRGVVPAPPPEGPWTIAPRGETVTRAARCVTNGRFRYTFFGDDAPAKAIAVRDALNRVHAVSAPPPEPRPQEDK